MTYNNSTTYGEIIGLVSSVFDNNDVFKLGKRDLARIFLRKLLEVESGTGDAELEEKYKACSAKEKIPKNSEDFWIFIEKEYLHLEVEPRSKFLEISFQVHEDLITLAKNLKHIKNKKELLEAKKKECGRLTADERYYRNQLDYFEKKNIMAKDEIVDFMAHGIKKWSIRKASVHSQTSMNFGSFLFESPYVFGRWMNNHYYDVDSLNKYSNKFTDIPVSSYNEIIEECLRSPENFKKYAIAYIGGVPESLLSASQKIENYIDRSHILADRRQVILTMLKHFENKDYISFVSMAPLQIEGIFADVCRELGVSEVQLDISSLNDKLLHIDEKMRDFFYFEYYSFKFPVLRNLIAHGGLIDGELEDTAIHLMLDLLPVCELTVSRELPIMHALEVLKEAGRGVHQKMIEWVDLRRSVQIPDFYHVDDDVKKVEENYTSQVFWDNLQNELNRLDKIDEIKQSEPIKIAGKLKSAGLAAERAGNFLKSSVGIASEEIKNKNERSESFKRIIKSMAVKK